MKSLTTFLFGLISICASAQIHITDSLIDAFYKQEIDHINMKLFNAAIEQKVSVYANDSFSRTLTKPEIHKKFSRETVRQIPDSRFPHEVMDTFIYTPLDPMNDLYGLRLSYNLIRDFNSNQISYQIKGIGPRFLWILGTGISLGHCELFFIKMADLPKILNHYELQTLKAILIQTSQLGDFRPYYVREVMLDTSEFAYNNALYATKYNNQSVLRDIDYEQKTPLLAEHTRHIASVVMARIAHKEYSANLPSKTIFRDVNLDTAYTNPEWDLRWIYRTKNDSENLIDLIDTVIVSPGDFFHPYDYTVWQNEDDFVFDFIYERSSLQTDAHIYMSFNTVKELFPQQDRIVLEAFLKDLFKE